MPGPGTPYTSYISPYNIRVDCFTANTDLPPPDLHLLTHTHSDHLLGLSANSFGQQVVCSEDAKTLLLKTEVYKERALFDADVRGEKVRSYAHLKVSLKEGGRDLLKTIPLNTPTEIELSADETITLTLIDANHCPGAVMYLIEGPKGAVLHTGDFRAEKWWLEALKHNPVLQPYLHAEFPIDMHTDMRNPFNEDCIGTSVRNTLDAIYLDTAAAFATHAVPSKNDAVSGLMSLIAMYPPATVFYINAWTWGYEDILIQIALTFNTKIHVDRYKFTQYISINHPLLRTIFTRDEFSTRFHACERFDRCSSGSDDYCTHPRQTSGTPRTKVVYVNPVTMSVHKWEAYVEETKAQLVRGEEPESLLVALSRHSTLPELEAFVSIFRPRRVVPNTLLPALKGLDWLALDKIFKPCLHDPRSRSSPEVDALKPNQGPGRIDCTDEALDTALKNLVGEQAERVAAKWAEGNSMRKRMMVMRDVLGEGMWRKLGLPNSTLVSDRAKKEEKGSSEKGTRRRVREEESDEDTEWGSQESTTAIQEALFLRPWGVLEAEVGGSQASDDAEPQSETVLEAEKEKAGCSREASPVAMPPTPQASPGPRLGKKPVTPASSPTPVRMAKLAASPARPERRTAIRGQDDVIGRASPILILGTAPTEVGDSSMHSFGSTDTTLVTDLSHACSQNFFPKEQVQFPEKVGRPLLKSENGLPSVDKVEVRRLGSPFKLNDGRHSSVAKGLDDCDGLRKRTSLRSNNPEPLATVPVPCVSRQNVGTQRGPPSKRSLVSSDSASPLGGSGQIASPISKERGQKLTPQNHLASAVAPPSEYSLVCSGSWFQDSSGCSDGPVQAIQKSTAPKQTLVRRVPKPKPAIPAFTPVASLGGANDVLSSKQHNTRQDDNMNDQGLSILALGTSFAGPNNLSPGKRHRRDEDSGPQRKKQKTGTSTSSHKAKIGPSPVASAPSTPRRPFDASSTMNGSYEIYSLRTGGSLENNCPSVSVDLSADASTSTCSSERAERRQKRKSLQAQRVVIAEKLRAARPDLAVSNSRYSQASAKAMVRRDQSDTIVPRHLDTSFKLTNVKPEEMAALDWEKIREITRILDRQFGNAMSMSSTSTSMA